MSLGGAASRCWVQLCRACRVGRFAPSGSAASAQSRHCMDRCDHRLDQLERIHMLANAGLWGADSAAVAMAEALERNQAVEKRSEP